MCNKLFAMYKYYLNNFLIWLGKAGFKLKEGMKITSGEIK